MFISIAAIFILKQFSISTSTYIFNSVIHLSVALVNLEIMAVKRQIEDNPKPLKILSQTKKINHDHLDGDFTRLNITYT